MEFNTHPVGVDRDSDDFPDPVATTDKMRAQVHETMDRHRARIDDLMMQLDIHREAVAHYERFLSGKSEPATTEAPNTVRARY